MPRQGQTMVEITYAPADEGADQGSLEIRTNDADEAVIAVEFSARGVLAPASRQVPGYCNQDAVVDISDAACTLDVLFTGRRPRFPCGDGTKNDPANLALIDWQPDGSIDISDAVGMLRFLFAGGPAHPMAVPGLETRGCVPIPGCEDNAACP